MKNTTIIPQGSYRHLLSDISSLLEGARRGAARSINSILTATYWQIGRRIIEFEQDGKTRARYGEEILPNLSKDLQDRFGRGFTERNLRNMRQFYLFWPHLYRMNEKRPKTEKRHTVCAELTWCHYRRLLNVKSVDARKFYETEAIQGGWSVRQLDRQINTQFYERTLLSRDKAAMLRKGRLPEKDGNSGA